MLHLAITYRKRTCIIEFETLDNCKIILTQHICSAECIHTFCGLLTSDFSCKKNYEKPDIQSEGIQFHNIWIIVSNSQMAGNSKNHNNEHFAYQLFWM